MKILPILFVALFLTGCGSSPVKYDAATQVDSSNQLAGYNRFSKPHDGWVSVIVVRDSMLFPSGAVAKLSIDGLDIAKFWGGNRLELYLPPANYIFAVEPTICFGCNIVETAVDIKPGKTYAFRISLRDTAFHIQQSARVQ
jgi:hypothetical protein